MSRLTKNEIIRKTASNLANPDEKILVNLKICRYTRLLVMSDLFKNKNVRLELDFNKMDFITNNTAYKLDDATYIGTVGSTITDISMDIYYNTKTVEENGSDVTYGYFIAFPTLFILPDVTTKSPRVLDLEAVVFGVIDNGNNMNSSTVELSRDESVGLYLKNTNINTPNKLTNKLISFPGIDDDSLYTVIEVYNSTGQCNGDNIQPSQYISLGALNQLINEFNTDTGIDLHIGSITQSSFNLYSISKSVDSNVKSGTLCIPLNF